MEEGRLETISMNFVKQKLMLFTVLVLKAAGSVAVPIITDFVQQNQSIKKNDILESREEVIVVNHYKSIKKNNIPESSEGLIVVNPFPNLEAYTQQRSQLNTPEDVLTDEITDINVNATENSYVSKRSKFVFKNFQLHRRLAEKVSESDTGFLSLTEEIDPIITNHSFYSLSNHNQATSNLNLKFPADLTSTEQEAKIIAAKKQSQQQAKNKFDLEILNDVLLVLSSPTSMLSLLAFTAVVSLSSKRSKNY